MKEPGLRPRPQLVGTSLWIYALAPLFVGPDAPVCKKILSLNVVAMS